MTARQLDILKFVAAMVIVLLAMTVAFVVVLDIRLPWEAPPPPPTEPREFDVSSLETMMRHYDPGRGMVGVQTLAEVEAAGRCAIVVESMENPTAAGYHFVFNAVEPPGSSVMAFPLKTAQLEILVADCRAAGSAASWVADTTQDVASAVRLARLAEEKARAAEQRARQPQREDSDNPITGVIERVKDGEVGGMKDMVEEMLNK